jgi:hypothetical protein
MGIAAIGKPVGKWCGHCAIGQGCKIYDSRPADCRKFLCAFLMDDRLPEDWRPSKSKIVLVIENDGYRRVAHVDPDRPAAWRAEPYYSTLKAWATAGASSHLQILVCIGRRTIVVLPHKDVDLGIIAEDERIVTREVRNAFGQIELDVLKAKPDDPSAAASDARADRSPSSE